MIAEKLRKSILQAAIEGKLTEQLPEDGDARDLVEEIKKEKEELVKAGKIKKEKPLPEITEEEIPFDIPDNWCWVRLGDVTTYGKNTQVHQKNIDDKAYIIELKDIEKNSNKLDIIDLHKIPKSSKNIFREGEVLYGKLRPYLNKCIVADISGYCSTEIMPFKGYGNISSKFLMYLMVTPYMDYKINSLTYGMDMPRLGKNDAINLVIPLPPLDEQERMTQSLIYSLDKLEDLKLKEIELSDLDNTMTTKLKNSILQAAMQGKLTDHLPKNEDARDLLEEIQAQKQNLIAEGKLKKQKPLPPITEEEIPFDIPDNWVWVRLGNVGKIQTGNTPKKTKPENYGDFIPFISPGDIKNGAIDYHNNGLSEIGKNNGRLVNRNSILQVCIGGSIGKAAINQKCVSFNQQINSFTPYIGDVNYYYYILSSKFFIDTMKNKSTGTATPIINKTMWSSILIPLAPLSEQEEIVKKISGLEKFRS